MNIASEKIIEKIKKLLELASSPNENEAQRAMEQAQKLMERHSVNMSDLKEEEETKIVTKRYENTDALSKQGIREHLPGIMNVIAPIFGVQSYIMVAGGGKTITAYMLVGYPTNIKVAEYAIDSIIAQGISEARVLYKQFRTVTFGFSFWSGYSVGLAKKFKPQTEAGQALTIYDPIKNWLNEEIKLTVEFERYNGIANKAGYEAGQRAEIRQAIGSKNEGKLLN